MFLTHIKQQIMVLYILISKNPARSTFSSMHPQ